MEESGKRILVFKKENVSRSRNTSKSKRRNHIVLVYRLGQNLYKRKPLYELAEVASKYGILQDVTSSIW